jgi:peptide/nickel transport system substrate-binding protein
LVEDKFIIENQDKMKRFEADAGAGSQPDSVHVGRGPSFIVVYDTRSFARNRDGHPMVFTLLASTDPLQAEIAEEVARQWRELDIQVTVVLSSPLDVRNALEQRNYQAALVELALPGDPDPYPLWHQTQITTGQNYAGLNDRELSEVIETARITLDPARRAELYYRFQEMFADQVPAILLYHPIYT